MVKSQNVDFSVSARKLTSDSKGFDGNTGTDVTSEKCLDFIDSDSLKSTLEVFKKESVSTKARDVPCGIRDLIRTQLSVNVVILLLVLVIECQPLLITASPNDRKESATITCDIASNFMYGDKQLLIADCSSNRAIKFTASEIGDSSNDWV